MKLDAPFLAESGRALASEPDDADEMRAMVLTQTPVAYTGNPFYVQNR
jgi:hypothetical protein